MPNFNNVRRLLGMKEVEPTEREKQVEAYEANPDEAMKDAQIVALDRMRFGRNPEEQGPALSPFSITPAEEAQGNALVSGVGGAIGSIGNVGGRGMASAFKNKAAQEKYLQQLSEFKPTPKTFSADKITDLRNKFNEILQSGKYSNEEIQKARSMLDSHEREAVRRGIKLPNE